VKAAGDAFFAWCRSDASHSVPDQSEECYLHHVSPDADRAHAMERARAGLRRFPERRVEHSATGLLRGRRKRRLCLSGQRKDARKDSQQSNGGNREYLRHFMNPPTS
jgi:hypothetical protein